MKKTTIIGAVLALFAIISGILYMNTRDKIEKGDILIEYQNTQYYFDIKESSYETVQGELVNGKGEVSQVNSNGIALIKYLQDAKDFEYSQVTVIADDAFSAVVSKEEIEYLLKDKDQYTLAVFGDSNSKRNVRNVVKLVLE